MKLSCRFEFFLSMFLRYTEYIIIEIFYLLWSPLTPVHVIPTLWHLKTNETTKWNWKEESIYVVFRTFTYEAESDPFAVESQRRRCKIQMLLKPVVLIDCRPMVKVTENRNRAKIYARSQRWVR